MHSTENELLMGWASADITPKGPVALFGQYYERISNYVESPLTITACALESAGANGKNEQAIMMSADLLWCTSGMQEAVRSRLHAMLPNFDVDKLFIFATHTHSAPEPTVEGEYGGLVLEKMVAAAVDAWNSRRPAGVSRVLGYAVAGHNRRVQYADGSTEMYGATDRADFIGLEGPSDSSLDLLYCFDNHNKLTGIIINVPCPAQVTEAGYYVSADYWDAVRQGLTAALEQPVYILAQCGAAGDLSPRDLPRGYKPAEPDMWNISGARAIGKRIVVEVLACYQTAQANIMRNAVFKHAVKRLAIPLRTVSSEEYEQSLAIVNEIQSREPLNAEAPDTAWNRYLLEIKMNEKTMLHGPWDNKNSDYGVIRKRELAVEQYKHQHRDPYVAELHVIRLGDMAMASNPFELFIDYGFVIKGRSKAQQTFLVQLSCDYADYLPTERAIRGGGYSGMSTMIGVDGGFLLANETVAMINDLFEQSSH